MKANIICVVARARPPTSAECKEAAVFKLEVVMDNGKPVMRGGDVFKKLKLVTGCCKKPACIEMAANPTIKPIVEAFIEKFNKKIDRLFKADTVMTEAAALPLLQPIRDEFEAQVAAAFKRSFALTVADAIYDTQADGDAPPAGDKMITESLEEHERKKKQEEEEEKQKKAEEEKAIAGYCDVAMRMYGEALDASKSRKRSASAATAAATAVTGAADEASMGTASKRPRRAATATPNPLTAPLPDGSVLDAEDEDDATKDDAEDDPNYEESD